MPQTMTNAQRRSPQMSKGRLEAFSDGVMAIIIITIMVLELKAPHQPNVAAMHDLLPAFLSYVLSFINVSIYWNNHHHLFQVVKHVNGSSLWANLHLLFWLSVLPFATAWMGENHFEALPVAFYGLVLLLAAVSYFILTRILVWHHEQDSTLAKALGRDRKGKLSLFIYAVAVPLAFANTWLAFALYILVTLIWVVPDRRIEKVLST